MFLPTRTEPQDFLDEAKMMKKFNHPHIVTLLGVCSEGLPIFIITELMPMGNLLDYLRNDGGVTLHTEHLLKYAAQVRTGVDPLILRYSLNIFRQHFSKRPIAPGFTLSGVARGGLWGNSPRAPRRGGAKWGLSWVSVGLS